MAEDVRREAHENINKILLSHSQGKEEKGGPGLGKQTYAKVTEATKPSFEFSTGGFMSNTRRKAVTGDQDEEEKTIVTRDIISRIETLHSEIQNVGRRLNYLDDEDENKPNNRKKNDELHRRTNHKVGNSCLRNKRSSCE